MEIMHSGVGSAYFDWYGTLKSLLIEHLWLKLRALLFLFIHFMDRGIIQIQFNHAITGSCIIKMAPLSLPWLFALTVP